jgi:Protein of unknown function (DUF3616)
MDQSFLLGRVLLRLGEDREAELIIGDLSAAALGPDGALWLASDELSGERITLSRLSPDAPGVFGTHQQFPLQAYIDLFDAGEEHAEADIEGLDYADGYLWFTGSHASKRKKPKGKDRKTDLARLSRVETEPNRYLLGRVPLIEGVPAKRGRRPSRPQETLSAARLADGEGGNALVEALRDDPHLGSFLRTVHGEPSEQAALLPLASKENGFDIEGLAVFGRRLFLGLRGPVLRGWAMLLAIEPELRGDGLLGLAKISSGQRRYRKHFIDLDGLGVRDLSRDGEDLLILAGPTMTLDGALRVYRLRAPAALEDDSLVGRGDGRLTPLFDVPRLAGGDHAEGMTPFAWAGLPGLLVVHDTPAACRRPAPGTVFADVFWMRD